MHYHRHLRHGSYEATLRNANGTYDAWVESNKTHKSDDCLIWPYWRDKHGYGPSRKMCIAAHGEPTGERDQAAHSCGNGHKGCMNPNHLYWATRKENSQEMARHGRSRRGQKNPFVKLTEKQVIEIQGLIGKKSAIAIAEQYKISRRTIYDIKSGKSWSWLTH